MSLTNTLAFGYGAAVTGIAGATPGVGVAASLSGACATDRTASSNSAVSSSPVSESSTSTNARRSSG
ncbi:hypothetical protein [Nocardia xishanensis]|uniref:hypothetical protein n=1 Tax=Nocardia xishanensis TaxID=238964 RepID=UPI0034404AB5